MARNTGDTAKSTASDTKVPEGRPIIVDGKRYVISPDAPVLPSIVSGDRDAELVVNENGMAMVLYNKPLPEDIDWVEYDVELALLTFVTYDGKVMGLGMKIHKPFHEGLSKAEEITLVYMENGESLGSIYPAKLIVRKQSVNL